MPEYTFEQLSPYDFEVLVRDLLQAEYGTRLEHFAPGRDRGIDLRYASDLAGTLIVQCKHFAGSAWSSLLSHLRHEVGKVKTLAPTRWILATSTRLTPARKDTIQHLFEPFCRTPEDVIGQHDLNNLLGRHPDIERAQFKLWLSSTPILQRILNSDVFSEQAAELESIRRRIARFVTNPSVGRASSVLEEHHFCLVAGVPGIGKTTLAEMLVLDHASRDYECFRIWEGIDEARRVFNSRSKQLFYYDDFLGRTGLREPLRRNEDQRLLRFIADVQHGANSRLILTTRDYILNQAQWVAEGLRSQVLDLAKCLVDLEDYAPVIRAHILYNHLFTSQLPTTHLAALLETRAYRPIVRHRNYNPRIIEAMTDALNVRSMLPQAYPNAFLDALEHPNTLWEVAFDGHLSPAGQNIVLALALMPDRARETNLREAFDALQQYRRVKYGQPIAPTDWTRALREVEGTFVHIEASHGEWHVVLHNPSIRDFIEGRLRTRGVDLDDLLMSAPFWDQIQRLIRIVSAPGEVPVGPGLSAQIAQQLLDRFASRSVLLTAVHYRATNDTWWRTSVQSPIIRFELLQAAVVGVAGGEAFLEAAAASVTSYLHSNDPNIVDVSRLLTQLAGITFKPGWALALWEGGMSAAFDQVASRMYDIDSYDSLMDFLEGNVDMVDPAILSHLRTSFEAFSFDELSNIRSEPDVDVRVSWYDDLKAIAERFQVALSVSREDMEDSDDQSVEDEDEGYRFGSGQSQEETQISDSELDDMFDSLRDRS